MRPRKTLRLIMVGDGALYEKTRALLWEEGAEDLSWLPGARDDIPRLMRGMDMFVLPSLAEGISNTILEAMASGLPIVATRVGGNAELVEEGETAYLVDRGDPEALAAGITRYVDNHALRAQHGERARVRALQEFGMESMVAKYIGVYDRVFANTRPGAESDA